MVESVRFEVARVPTLVGRRPTGGGLFVTLGSQRISLAVVSWLAIESEDAVLAKVLGGDCDCAVLREGSRRLAADDLRQYSAGGSSGGRGLERFVDLLFQTVLVGQRTMLCPSLFVHVLGSPPDFAKRWGRSKRHFSGLFQT